MSFPSSQSLCDLFDQVFCGLSNPAKEFIRRRVLEQFMQTAAVAAPSAEFIDSVRVELNELLRHGGVGDFGSDAKEVTGQKAFAKGAVRTCFTLLFYTHMVYTNSSKLLNMEGFLMKYPSFRLLDEKERELLLKFRNYTVAFIAFRGAKDNKAKCLFAAGVLSLEKNFVYKTGSGQSEATRRRVEIYEVEGDIKPQPSKKHTVNPKTVVSSTSSKSGSLTTGESSLGKRSRTRHTECDDEVSVSSELTEDSECKRSRASSLGDVEELDFYLDLFDRDEIEIQQEVDRDAAVPCVEEPSFLTLVQEEEFADLASALQTLFDDFEFDSELFASDA